MTFKDYARKLRECPYPQTKRHYWNAKPTTVCAVTALYLGTHPQIQVLHSNPLVIMLWGDANLTQTVRYPLENKFLTLNLCLHGLNSRWTFKQIADWLETL